MELNVFGEPLKMCSQKPLTGFYRDGNCSTGSDDNGRHTVCAIMTDEFLQFSKMMGNDLTTPLPHYQFPGLKAGDRWCLCALRWVEAWKAGNAPQVLPEATHEKTLDLVTLEELIKYFWKDPSKEQLLKEE
ncbi:MAG: hypothetical protein FD155_828 [Bacteroidetes bacterium]|nr:MAG: hypothetical protein FD155_828 [Bacteroidota bacterium]